MERLPKPFYYLEVAKQVASRSTCLSKQYGAVIVKDDRIISTGYNGAPRGRINCCDRGICIRDEWNIPRGIGYADVCRASHAEMNAIISASRQEMLGSILYLVGKEATTGEYVENPAPCSICKRLIINAGIERVYIRLSKTRYDLIETCDWKQEDIVGGY